MNWSYIAGFFDGEGSVRLTSRKVIITIANTNKHVLEEIRKYVGYGNVYSDKRRDLNLIGMWHMFMPFNVTKTHFNF